MVVIKIDQPNYTMRTSISSSVVSIACLFAISSICLLDGGIVNASLLPSQTSSKITKLGVSLTSSQTRTDISFKRQSTTAAGWNILQSIPRGGSSVAVDDGSEEMSESEEDELSSDLSEDSELDESEDETPSTSNSNGPPIKLTIKTNLSSTLIDQKLDFTASRTRSIQSIKLAISKSMVGRPPLSSIILKYHGRTLHDEECMFDLLDDLDSDEEEEDSDIEDNIGEEEDEDTIKLTLTADILPPIDTKFGIELKEKLHKLSTQEILEAYCVNMAGMVYGQELFVKESELYESKENDGLDEELDELGDEEQELHTSSTQPTNENHSLNIRKKAALIQSQFESNLSSETKQLLQEEHIRVKQHLSSDSTSTSSSLDDSDEIIYGLISQNEINSSSNRKGRRRTLKGGASMNVKRSLQRNLNVVRIVFCVVCCLVYTSVHPYSHTNTHPHTTSHTTPTPTHTHTHIHLQNWADTTRNSLLFLFFGYFGGRNSFSRALLLLASPMCFFIQTRPVKVALKQVFYTVGEPPSILLSLLPAPQQAIMSLKYGAVMKGLYGEKVLEDSDGIDKEWLDLERMEEDEEEMGVGGSSSFGGDLSDEDEYGEYDNQYDDDEYDGEYSDYDY